jgi:hypothetical protein
MKGTFISILQLGVLLIGLYTLLLLFLVIPNLAKLYSDAGYKTSWYNPGSTYGFWIFLSIGVVYLAFAAYTFYRRKTSKKELPLRMIGVAALMNLIPLLWYAFASYASSQAVLNLITVNTPPISQEQLGSFVVTFKGDDGRAVITHKICFEQISDSTIQYCFETNEPSVQGELPQNHYYAHVLRYPDQSAPSDVINLNQCLYAQTEEGIEQYCVECRNQKESIKYLYPDAPVVLSPEERNVTFGGERVVFTIEANKLFNLGTIDTTPWLSRC